MQETHLGENELFLSIESPQFIARIRRLIVDVDYRNRLVKFASHLGRERQWDAVTLEYVRVLGGNSNMVMNNWVHKGLAYSI